MVEVIILSNSIAQTLAVGQSLVLDKKILHTGCRAECHRDSSPVVNLTRQGIYEVAVKLNVTTDTAAGVIQMAVVADGGTLPETIMTSTPAAAGDVNNVFCETAFKTCGCNDAIVVQNVGTVPVTVSPDASVFIKRIA